MLTTAVITTVKTRTSHDSDDQVSTAQYLDFVQAEQDRIRRELAVDVPELYQTTAAATINAGSDTITPVAMLHFVRLEKLVGSRYYPVPATGGLSTNGIDGTEFRWQGSSIVVSPVEDADGTYRYAYVTLGATLTGVNPEQVEIPVGLEEVLIERVCAQVRWRCYEDGSGHEAKAQGIWDKMLPKIKRRYGAHPRPGLQRIRGDV